MKRPTDLNLHCLLLSMWICINSLDQESDRLTNRNGHGILIYSVWQGSVGRVDIFITQSHSSSIMISHWMSVCLSIHLYFVSRWILSKLQWIFTKLGMCIDIVEIWFGIANGQNSSNFEGVICETCPYVLDDNWSKCQGILTKLVLTWRRSDLGSLIGK